MEQVTSEPLYGAKVLGDEGCRIGSAGMRVGVFVMENGDERQIGEYQRNYHSFGVDTFHPFKLGDRWLALYSNDYTCTRLMSLPDCADIGGEEPDGYGFCPVEYHIPILHGREYDESTDPEPVVANHQSEIWCHKVGRRWYWPDDKNHPEPNEERKAAYLKAREESHAALKAWSDRHPFVQRCASFGFVAGCVWGDDTSWKIQFLDLSRAAEGKITRDDRFGYIELPAGVSLKDAIHMCWIDNLNAPISELKVEIALPVTFSLDGKRLELQ